MLYFNAKAYNKIKTPKMILRDNLETTEMVLNRKGKTF
jgi:hypothetical protein